jgi:hypothetical protein
MSRSDWLLLLVVMDPRSPLDPVRLQKAMFLLAMSERLPDDQRYRFEPYAYGPMSRDLYRDIRALCRMGWLEARPVDGHDWRTVTATAAGRRRAIRVRAGATGHLAALTELRNIRRHVDSLGFAELLDHVYALHPEYATRSVFRRR